MSRPRMRCSWPLRAWPAAQTCCWGAHRSRASQRTDCPQASCLAAVLGSMHADPPAIRGLITTCSTAGRCNNLFILAHSSAALFAVPLAARRAGALILLGSYMFPSADYHASLTEWNRPVVHLGGRLDGQARFSRVAFAALDAAACADKFGDRCSPRLTLHLLGRAPFPSKWADTSTTCLSSSGAGMWR